MRHSNGQVERMNRTIKEATVKRFPYERHCRWTASAATTSPRWPHSSKQRRRRPRGATAGHRRNHAIAQVL